MFRSTFFCLLIFTGFSGTAQTRDTSMWVFKNAERELQELQKKTFFSRNEKMRLEGNREFLAVWERIISNPAILQYPFDSLKEISVLTPRDKKFMLITWNLQRDDGTHSYFGFLLVNNSKKIKKGLFRTETENSYEYFKLLDRSMTVKSPENYIGTPDKWFGMLYTQLVECDGYYTLIAWDGNDKLTQRKFIDVLYFKNNGDPVFGKDVFKFAKKNPRRLMFEWSQEVSMSIRYIEKENRIVYSHLSPNQVGTVLEGQYQYYGPDGRFDALEQRKDKWVLVEDISANSDIAPMKESKKPDPKKQTPVFKPKSR